MKFHQNWSKNHQNLEEFHQNLDDLECFLGALGGPESWEMHKDTLLLVENNFGTPFLARPKHLTTCKFPFKSLKNS